MLLLLPLLLKMMGFRSPLLLLVLFAAHIRTHARSSRCVDAVADRTALHRQTLHHERTAVLTVGKSSGDREQQLY